jgi:hypothetical protein
LFFGFFFKIIAALNVLNCEIQQKKLDLLNK